MAKFRKKPVVIEAVQITERAFDDPHSNPEHIPGVEYDPIARCAVIDTKEGRMKARLGDWIIKGVQGELYPCKPDIFEATYEPAFPPAEPPPEALLKEPTPEEAWKLGAEAMRSCITAWLVVEGGMDPAKSAKILGLPTPDFQLPEKCEVGDGKT
jgi:hypothetical protein